MALAQMISEGLPTPQMCVFHFGAAFDSKEQNYPYYNL